MLDAILKSLNIDPTIMLYNGALFIALFLILNQVYWKRMMKHLDNRRAEIAHAYQTVEDSRHEMENLRTEYQGRMAKIEADARARIQQTVRDAQAQREAILAEARARSEAIQQEGMAAIAQEREKALHDMERRLADVAAHAIEKVIGSAPDPAQKRLVEQYISETVARS
jgi:F-type H+-transporting ATPase subunit b